MLGLGLLSLPKKNFPVDSLILKPSTTPPSNLDNALWLDETLGRLVLGSNPGQPLAFLSDITNGGGGSYPETAVDMTIPTFIPSGDIVVPSIGGPQGDPFIVFDEDNNQYVMYYFTVVGVNLTQNYKTAPRVGGPWSVPTLVSTLNGYHKFVMLVNQDMRNQAQVIGGVYHGYASSFLTGSGGRKQISHFTSPSLYGPWTVTGVVLDPNLSISPYDSYTCDTPCAISDTTNIYLYYMANPASNSTTPTGFASVIMNAVTPVATPQGPFARNNAPLLLPSTTPGDFDFGWLGGVQIVRVHNSTVFTMVYNAGYTRPLVAGDEPIPGDIGVAFSASINGPWVRSSSNPITLHNSTPDHFPGQAIYWRGFYIYDPIAKMDYLYFNASAPNGGGGEAVSYSLAGVGDYSNVDVGAVQTMDTTTGILDLNNTHLYLPEPGVYKISYTVNVFANSLPALPNGLDIQFVIVDQTGTQATEGGISLKYTLPNMPFWNDDQETSAVVVVSDTPMTYRLTAQVVGGIPPSPPSVDLQIRHPRYSVLRVTS